MIDFAPTTEQSLLRESAAHFLRDRCGTPPVARRAGAVSLWPAFAELGWLALTLPDALGGMGLPRWKRPSWQRFWAAIWLPTPGSPPSCWRPGCSAMRVHPLNSRIFCRALRMARRGSPVPMWKNLYRLNHGSTLPDAARLPACRYLDTRTCTIFGGTAKIQHDINARDVIGS